MSGVTIGFLMGGLVLVLLVIRVHIAVAMLLAGGIGYALDLVHSVKDGLAVAYHVDLDWCCCVHVCLLLFGARRRVFDAPTISATTRVS